MLPGLRPSLPLPRSALEYIRQERRGIGYVPAVKAVKEKSVGLLPC